MNAEFAGLIRASGNNPPIAVAANNYRLAAQVGVVSLFNGRKERVAINMREGQAGQLFMRDNAPGATSRAKLLAPRNKQVLAISA